MPAAVTAPGLPAPRFWEFEDGRLNLASLQPAETDLSQLLLIETLSGYGNDWFVIGVELPVGRLVSGRSLVVTDTFGTRTLLRPHGDPATGGAGRWGLFQQAMPFDADEPEGAAITNLLYLVSPIDVLPELLPIIGVTDDAGVAVWLFSSVSAATGLYLRWEKERAGLPPR
jgi:hypothetical protein